MSTNKYFTTTSLSLAAAIQCISKAKLKSLKFGPSHRASFLFDRTEDPSIDEIVSLFWEKKLPIDASTYFETLRYMKARLFESKNEK